MDSGSATASAAARDRSARWAIATSVPGAQASATSSTSACSVRRAARAEAFQGKTGGQRVGGALECRPGDVAGRAVEQVGHGVGRELPRRPDHHAADQERPRQSSAAATITGSFATAAMVMVTCTTTEQKMVIA